MSVSVLRVALGTLQKVSPLLMIFFFITSVGLGVLCLVLGTKNIHLQTRLADKQESKIEVVIHTQELADAISKGFQEQKVQREVIYEKVKGDTETIVKHDTVFLNTCISNDGMQHYNNFISSPLTE